MDGRDPTDEDWMERLDSLPTCKHRHDFPRNGRSFHNTKKNSGVKGTTVGVWVGYGDCLDQEKRTQGKLRSHPVPN